MVSPLLHQNHKNKAAVVGGVRLNMDNLQVLLSNVEILRTGHDGGHLYLMGKTDVPTYGKTDAYCYFESKDTELEFEIIWKNSNLIITSSRWEFNKGTGLSLHDISWSLT
jgi:hypothetical protein